jgi:hypothetical protein
MPRELRKRRERRLGSALVLVLGILALLSFLVAAFALEARLSLRAARNHQDQEQARLVARAGIERARFELRRAVCVPAFPTPWIAPDVWDYARHAPATLTSPSDVFTTTTPSLGASVAIPAAVAIAGTPGASGAAVLLPWPSGFLGSTYFHTDSSAPDFYGDYYTLKIVDQSACLAVNDANPNLATLLDALAKAAGVTDSGVGTEIVGHRPPLGYLDLQEVGAVLAGLHPTTGTADFATLAPYLTCYERADRSVIAGHSGSGSSLHPDLTLQPRVPINLNAAPLAVLTAALTGISGKTPDGATATITGPEATTLAQAMIAYRAFPTLGGGSRRYGFASWSEVAAFLAAAPGLSPQQAALVLANANPNTDLNKFVPDASIYQCLDKADLTSSTTEFCLRSPGIFAIESVGTILAPDGTIVAQQECRAVVSAWTEHTLSSQFELESDRGYGLGPAGTNIAQEVANKVTVNSSRPGLNPVTSFPEYQNQGNTSTQTMANSDFADPYASPLAGAGIREALWDGQLTPNAIWKPDYLSSQLLPTIKSDELDRSFDGFPVGTTSYTSRSGTTTSSRMNFGVVHNFGLPGTALPTDPQVARWPADPSSNPPLAQDEIAPAVAGADPATNPDFVNGNDLQPFGVHVGRSAPPARKVMWLQCETLTTASHSIAQLVSGSVTVLPWKLSSLDAQTFSFWFKPGQRIPQNGAYWDGAHWAGPGAGGDAKVVLFEWHSGTPSPAQGQVTVGSSTIDLPGPIDWGATAWAVIYLVQVADGFELHAEFDMPLKEDAPDEAVPSSMNHAYARAWKGPVIAPGTWRHVMLPIWVPNALNALSPLPTGNTNTALFVDGNPIASVSPEPAWPTESDPQARLLQAGLENSLGSKNTYSASSVPTPVLIPPGENPAATLIPELSGSWTAGSDGVAIWFGGVSPKDTVAASDTTNDGPVRSFGDFDGLLYEVEVDGNVARSCVVGTTTWKSPVAISLFNEWQTPTPVPALPQGAPTFYVHHIAEYEVEDPVVILGLAATCWIPPAKGTGIDFGLGAQLWFKPQGTWDPSTTWGAFPSATTFTSTRSFAWCGFLNAMAFPNRSGVDPTGVGTGFLTQSAQGYQHGEWYFFAIMFPTFPSSPAGQPPMPALVDDLTIFSTPWEGAKVLLEEDVP